MFKFSCAVAALSLCTLGLQGVHAQTTQPLPGKTVAIVEIDTTEDIGAALDARIAALKTVIRLQPEQDKLWAPAEAAIRQAAKNAVERREQRAKGAQPQNFVDILERTADAEAARAADLKTVAIALKPLVASLTETQQRRIPAFLGLREGRYGVPQPSAELWIFEEEG